jgi:type IV secretion system protein VirB10
MIDPKREAETVVAGERTSTPVSGTVVDGNRAFARRGIAVCALIVFGAFFIWGGWGRAKTGNEDRATKPVVSLRAAYEAPRDPELPARPQAPVQEAALMPVIRPPVEQPARSPGDELLESARRAPVLVYNRPPRNPPASETSGPDGFMTGALPYSFGQPEPRNELADKLKPTPLEGVRAARLPNRHLVVTQGTAIPCVLETAMSSDVAGFVSCVIERDVMSDSGQVVLMEKGTQVVGEYRGQVRRGSKRMFVLWSRAKTPTGVIVNLASPATDALGRSGFDGQIDTHFWERFGGALLLSIVADGSQIASRQLSNADIEIRSSQSAGSNAAAIATEQSINIPPTLNKNQGELVSIFVARDLDFSSVYDLRLVGNRTQVLDRTVRRVTKP